MALESVTYIGDLVATNPASSDPKQQGDDHIRNLKAAARNCFPGFAGPIIVGGSDTGVANAYVLTPATTLKAYTANTMVVAKLNATNTAVAPSINISGLGARTIKAMDGNPLQQGDLVAGEYVAMVDDGTAYRLIGVTKRYVDQLAFSSVLPSQTGNADKFLKTDGTSAAWATLTIPNPDLFTPVAVAALDIDLSLGRYFTKTVATNSTFNIINVPAGGTSFVLEVQLDAGSITLPASVKPADGVMPSLATGKTHMLMFITKNAGTRWRVGVLKNYDN